MLEAAEAATEKTGHYAGIAELALKEADPIRYELLHARIIASLIAGRQATRMIAASPVVREVQELSVCLFTPEGHCVASSTGIQVHVVPMGEALRWLIRNGYEQDPGIDEGDGFACNDSTIAGMHPADVYDFSPIFFGGELVAWVGTVIMEMDIGAAASAPAPASYNVDKFTDGFFVCMEKISTRDRLRRDFLTRAERTLRFPEMFVLHRKGALAANVRVREDVGRLIEEFGLDYFKGAIRELIEDSRRIQLFRMRQRTVPGRFQSPHHLEIYLGDKPVPAYARKDVLRLIPAEIEITGGGEIRVDFDGAGDWGWHSLNSSPSGIKGGLSITLVQTMAYDGTANFGTLMPGRVNAPVDTVVNPSSAFVATANIWAPVLTFCANFIESLSRSYFSRGFVEEILLGPSTSGFVMMGRSRPDHPRRQVMGEYAMGGDHHFTVQSGGARGIADGIEHGMYNPETDMGSTEVTELVTLGVFVGSRVLPDSGGFGKYRGGFNLCTTQIIQGVEWAIGETLPLCTNNRLLQNRGLFGGYPGNPLYVHLVRNANTKELIEKRLPLPKVEGDPRNPDIRKLVQGEHTLLKMWWCTEDLLHDYDLVQICYQTNNGGYGDPLDRKTDLIRKDLELGFTSVEACRNVYCAEPRHDPAAEEWAIDEGATGELREARRKERLEQAVPFRQWWSTARQRILERDLDPLLLEMYDSSAGKSPRFAEDYRRFWSLPEDFSFREE
jgi:N-methylhydantoinase B/oxoprolinase/acetone carboxylase alpha subunit